ncbi:MAG: Glyoxalase/Bleomycin resistance protein/Dioxygenase superfamily protein [Syntrophorhabdus sp. PtaU1.Bin058]|nr:MAG: Glyoxalase/Bleomycin resistance protein/Dioxygenase superfamily protein [Syntrophorhabdus sp. PtaU1.Bin058]
MEIRRISHIGVGVRNLGAAKRFFETSFGFKTVEESTGMGLHVAFLAGGATPIELIQDEVPGGTIDKFIEKRGEGIHHLCFEVADIRKAMEELRSCGIRFLDQKPREGAHEALVAFIHPKDSYGVLIELAEYPGKTEAGFDHSCAGSAQRES